MASVTLAEELRELARQAQRRRDEEGRRWAEGLLEQVTLESRAAAAGGRDGINFTVTPPPGWRRSDLRLLTEEVTALGRKTGLNLTLSNPEDDKGRMNFWPLQLDLDPPLPARPLQLDLDPPLPALILRVSWRG